MKSDKKSSTELQEICILDTPPIINLDVGTFTCDKEQVNKEVNKYNNYLKNEKGFQLVVTIGDDTIGFYDNQQPRKEVARFTGKASKEYIINSEKELAQQEEAETK